MMFGFILLISTSIAVAVPYTKTPPMGWNSWNKFACNISEDTIKETADVMGNKGELGLLDLGYNFLLIDDCWQASERNSDGTIAADKDRFSSGINSISDYVHENGLKFGIYSSAGFKTCQGFPASLGLENVDATTYASWNVDYLKYDNCYQDRGAPFKRYGAMGEALENAKADIFYALCEWGRENPAVWAPEVGASMWRVTMDIKDFWGSIISRAAIDAPLWRYSGKDKGWNDPDMLEIGNGGCSTEEYRTHFSLWAVLKAPLILGNDVRLMTTDSEIYEIVTNKEIIAIDQDEAGYQGRIVHSDVSEKLATSDFFKNKLIATKRGVSEDGQWGDKQEDQAWQVNEDGTILSTSTGLCLNELDDVRMEVLRDFGVTHELDGAHFNFTLSEHAVSTAPCDQATRWDFGEFVGGSIVSRNTGNCLEVSTNRFVPEVQGKRIQTGPCNPQHLPKHQFDSSEHQGWVTNPIGTLMNLYQRQYLTVDRDAFHGFHYETWTAPLSGDARVVLLLNRSPSPQILTLSLEQLGLSEGELARVYQVRDLWEHRDLEKKLSKGEPMEFMVPAHGQKTLKLW